MGEQISRTCTEPNEYVEKNENQPTNFSILQTEKKQPDKLITYSTKKKINIFDNQIDQSRNKLKLVVLSSLTMQQNNEIYIDQNGLVGKESQEGNAVYFGCKRKNAKNGFKINDVVIPCIDGKLAEKNRGQFFYIRYINQQYKIRDLGIGFGCFRRVDQYTLKNNSCIHFGGQMYMIVYTCYGQDLLKNTQFNNLYDVKEFFVKGFPCDRSEFLRQNRYQAFLKINIYGGPSKDENYVFSSINNLPITIGRSCDCMIRYHDCPLLSKYQCTIYFDGCWMVMDGIQGKRSQNGIWAQIQQETIITDGMSIKCNDTIFKIDVM